jgi:hypothetical protein
MKQLIIRRQNQYYCLNIFHFVQSQHITFYNYLVKRKKNPKKIRIHRKLTTRMQVLKNTHDHWRSF